jgi:large repetitive protein
MEFEDLTVDTGGNFDIDGVTGDEVHILGEYLVLETVGLSRDEEEGISVSSSFFFMLPEPVDESGNLDVTLGRDGIDGTIFVDSEIPDHSNFNPEEMDEIEIELGSEITLTLTDILFDVDPRNITESHIATAGMVSIFGNEQIYLGESGSVEQNPGISVKNRLGQSPVKYNITGNPSFEFDRDFFTVEINSDVALSNADSFEIILSGELATALIPGVDYVQGNYEGFTIDSSGIADHGNIAPGGFKIVS